MIDSFSLGITHLLMLLVCWHLLGRSDVDDEGEAQTGFAPKKSRDG